MRGGRLKIISYSEMCRITEDDKEKKRLEAKCIKNEAQRNDLSRENFLRFLQTRVTMGSENAHCCGPVPGKRSCWCADTLTPETYP